MNFLPTINLSSPSWDLFILLFFVVIAFLYVLILSSRRSIASMASIYMALAISDSAPYLSVLNSYTPYLKVLIFLLLFGLLFYFLASTLFRDDLPMEGLKRKSRLLVDSFFHTGLMLSIILSDLPAWVVANISFGMRNIFISQPAKFFWLIMPIVIMVLLNRQPKPKMLE